MTSAQRKDHLDGLAIGILLACCMFWGLQQILVKAIVHEVAPLFQASLRCIGACVLLMLWCRWRGVKLFERDGSLWAGLLAGALFAAEFACIYLGLRHTTASRLTVFLYTSPFWVAALVPLFVRSERLRPLQWLGLGCAFVAVAFAMREGLAAAGGGATGDLLGLAAGALRLSSASPSTSRPFWCEAWPGGPNRSPKSRRKLSWLVSGLFVTSRQHVSANCCFIFSRGKALRMRSTSAVGSASMPKPP